MRKIIGVLLALFGVAFSYAAYQSAPAGREDQLVEVTRILTNPGVANPGKAAPAQLPKQVAAASDAKPATPSTSAPVSERVTAPTLTADTPKAAPQKPATNAWQTSVSAEAKNPGSTAPLTSATPGDMSARYELVRALQTELKRHGCYRGEATGSWTNSSKRALTAFLERVNATLPVENPDYIQLTLLKGQANSVCGRECPKGQSLTGDGSCVPSAILAANDAKKKSASAQVADAKPAPPVAVAANEPEKLPWADQPVAAHELQRRPEFAGRMSVGAPPPVTEEPNAAPVQVPVETVTAPPADQQVARLDETPAQAIEPDVVQPQIDEPTVIIKPKALKQVAALAPSPADRPAPIARPAKQRAAWRPARPVRVVSRPAPRVRTAYYRARNVQNLFLHPLGRM